MFLRKKSPSAWLFLLFITPILLFLLWRSVPVPLPTLPEAIVTTDHRPVQELYRITVQANDSGWTAENHLRAGQLSYEIGDIDAALAHWEAASLLQPDNVNLLRRLAENYLTLNQWTPLVDTLRTLITFTPDDTWAHYQLGLALVSLNPTEAIDHLRLVTTAGYGDLPTTLLTILNQPESAMQVGFIFADRGMWVYAERAFIHAADMGQSYADALAYTGLAREMQGKPGIDWIQQAAALDSTNPTAYYTYGIVLRNQRDFPNSLDAFTIALSFDPKNPAYYAELGNTYWEYGDLIGADYWLRQAVVISNFDPKFLQILSDFYNQEAPALTAAGVDTAIDASISPNAHADVGWTLYSLGAKVDAIASLDEALESDPSNPRALFYKARIAIDDGDTETAKTLLQQVIRVNVDFASEAEALLATLNE